MPIPKEIIDNSEGNKLISFLNNILKENPKTKNNYIWSSTDWDNRNAYIRLAALLLLVGGASNYRSAN